MNFKDCRPERSKKHFPLKGKEKAMKMGIENQSRQSNMSNVSTLDATGTAQSQSARSNTSVQQNTQTGGIVKTVLLPFDEIVNLKNEMEYLKLYKQQQKELFEETIQGYRKDKIIRLQEWNLKE